MPAAQACDQQAPARPRRSLAQGVESLTAYPRFRLLWLSNLFFFGGVWTQTLILGWLVYDLTNSSLRLAVFSAIRLAPMLLGPLSGVVSDRVDRARFILSATVWALIAVVALAALTSGGLASYWVLVAGGLLIGLAQSPTQPARSSLVLDFVGRQRLSNANALNSMALNMTQVVGPALGGVLIGVVGAAGALWISAAWFAISAGLLWPLRHSGRDQVHTARESVGQLLVGGIRLVLANRLMTTVLMVTLVANIMLWPIYQTFMPAIAKDVLGLNATGLGLLLTCAGVGGLAGSMIIACMGDFEFKGGVFLFGTAVWGSLWVLFALSRWWPLSFLLMICVGLASAAFGVLQTTLMLMLADPSAYGRALGIQELAIGIQPFAALGLGAVATLVGLPHTVLLSSLALVVLVLLLAARSPALVRYSR
jgi:MFS family permease